MVLKICRMVVLGYDGIIIVTLKRSLSGSNETCPSLVLTSSSIILIQTQ